MNEWWNKPITIALVSATIPMILTFWLDYRRNKEIKSLKQSNKDLRKENKELRQKQEGYDKEIRAEIKELLKEQEKRVRLEEKVKNLEAKTEKSLKEHAERAAEFIITAKEELDRGNRNYGNHVEKLRQKACPNCLKEFEKIFVKIT